MVKRYCGKVKYIDFKKKCSKTEIGRHIFDLWMNGKLPLTWAMKLLIICEHYGKNKTI